MKNFLVFVGGFAVAVVALSNSAQRFAEQLASRSVADAFDSGYEVGYDDAYEDMDVEGYDDDDEEDDDDTCGPNCWQCARAATGD